MSELRHTTRRRGRPAAILAVVIAAGLLAATAGASALPRMVTGGGPARSAGFQSRPYEVVYSGDGAAFLAGARSSRSHLRWSSWTADAGRGSGADWRNDCTPDCADGHFHAYPATVTVDMPRTIDGRRLFTRMRITYRHGRPRDSRRRGATITFRLRVSHGSYYWA